MRKDRRLLSSWVIDSWVSGLGRQQVNVATASDLSSLWDVENLDTRIDGQLVLSPAFNTCTIVPSRGDVDVAYDHLGNINFVNSAYAGVMELGFNYLFAPPLTLGSQSRFGRIATTGLPSAQTSGSITAIKSFGNLIAITAHRTGSGQNDKFFYTDQTSGSLLNSAGIRLGSTSAGIRTRIGDLGGTLHVLYYDAGGGQAKFFLGNHDLTLSSTPVATLPTTMGSYLAPLVADGLTQYAQLPRGIYDFDPTPAIVVDTSRAQDRNCVMALFQNNNLIFKSKKSLVEYDGTNLNAVGYDQRDGLVSEKMGEITAMVSTWEQTFAAVLGATYSHILTIGQNRKWQYYARVPSPGLWVREMFLSDSPDAIDRLWIIYGNYGYPGYFLNPMVNPLQAATYSYVPTGHFRPPHYGGDLPEENGAFFDLAFNGDALGGTNSIHILYGLNGANPVSTLGVVSTDNFAITFASPAGVEAYKIQPEFVLTGATSGTTPVFRQAIAHYLKLPEQRQLFDFEVDLEKTAMQETRPLEAVIGSLNYERNLRTLMPFWYGQIATTHVKVIDMPSLEETENGRVYEEERKGTIKLRLAEIL